MMSGPPRYNGQCLHGVTHSHFAKRRQRQPRLGAAVARFDTRAIAGLGISSGCAGAGQGNGARRIEPATRRSGAGGWVATRDDERGNKSVAWSIEMKPAHQIGSTPNSSSAVVASVRQVAHGVALRTRNMVFCYSAVLSIASTQNP